MDQNFFSKLNLYDHIGYIMVGAVALLVLAFDACYFFKVNILPFNLNTFLVWFIVTYFSGHIVQGIANFLNSLKLLRFLVPEEKNYFDDFQKEILEQVKEYFGLKDQDETRVWSICYMYTVAKDLTGQVQAFNSYYSLYRGWFVIFLFESFFLLFSVIITYNWETLLLFLISVFITIILYKRSRRFWNYIRGKVIDTFIII